MARRRTRTPLNVYLNGRLVGSLRRAASGATDFQYARDWLEWEFTFPISVSLPLREDRYTGDPVIAVFDNLLPDNDVVRRKVAENVKADGHDAYSLLAKIGRDCVGALQFLPEGEAPDQPGAVEGRPVDAAHIAREIRNLAATPLGVGEDEEFRISLAGAQEKTAFLYWNGQWHLPHGSTATTHILKPQLGMLRNGIDMSRSVENEYLCLKLTQALGLPSARAEMDDFDGERVLVVERFDREWTSDGRLLRLPQEDCCQALSVPPTLKYNADSGPGITDILDLLTGSDEPGEDQRTFMKAQIVFWLLGATDGHAKNFSIFLQPGGRFRLTPLYDVMSVQPAVDARQIKKNQFKFAMAVGRDRHYVMSTIAPRHFTQTAKQARVPDTAVEEIFTELASRAETAIDETVAGLPDDFPAWLTDSIAQGVLSRLRLIEQPTA